MLVDISQLLLLPDLVSLLNVLLDYVHLLPKLNLVNLLALFAPTVGFLDLILEDLLGQAILDLKLFLELLSCHLAFICFSLSNLLDRELHLLMLQFVLEHDLSQFAFILYLSNLLVFFV